MKHLFLLVLIALWAAAVGCSSPGEPAGTAENVGKARTALTALDVRPSNQSVAAFGEGATPTYGQVITVPAADAFLKSFGFEMETVPSTVVFRGEVYAWDGTKATGGSLYESGSVSTSAATQQTVVFDTGRLALTAGSQYVLFVTASKDVSTGSGDWGSRNDNPYAGGSMVSFSAAADQWTSQAWTATPGSDAAFTVTFDGPLASTTSLTSSVNPSVSGEAVTFTATVTGSGGTATGNVVFKDGATTLGTVALNGAGQASLPALGTLSVAAHSITAEYAGSGNYLASTSNVISQVVNKSGTMTGLTSSKNPSTAGDVVTFTATVTAVSPGTGIPSGSVTFREGASVLGTGAVSALGVATFSTATLPTGNHDIVADYGGDTRFAISSSSVVAQAVNQDSSSVALGSSLAPSTFGASVTFTATVTSGALGGTPTGTVNFKDGANVLGTGMLSAAGVATFSTSALAAGSHSITADYGGDTKHTAASAALTQVVNVGATSTVSASLTNPSVFGQSVTFTAKVTGTGGTPSGNVTFLDGATPLVTNALNGAGQSSFTTSALGVATHSISISYAGDANFGPSTSNVTSQKVTAASTTTTLISSSNPSIVGSSVTFTAKVTVVSPGVGIPTGTVTFREGATTLGTGNINASGNATFSTSALPAGTHAITADYGGATSFAASTSANVSQVVNVDGVAATVVSSLSPSIYGTSVTFTATVQSVGPGGTPTGTVTFKDGATTIGTSMLDAAGATTFATAALTGGTHSISAHYGGDAKHGTATGTVAQVVTVATTSTALSSSVNPAVFGQSVSISATVTSGAAGTRTGSVTFKDGAAVLGTSAVNAAGIATFTTTALAVAAHPVSGIYSGDGNYATSTSVALSQTIAKASTTTAVVSSSNPSLVSTSVTLTATVSAAAPGAGTRTGTVTFKDGASELGTATVNNAGVATLAVATLTAGMHNITAEYAGDGSFNPSTSAAFAQNVSASAATIALSAGPTPSSFGQPVTFTAKLAGTSGTPTGTVAFKDGATELGTAPLDASAVAKLTVATLPAGTHTITARYSGSTTYAWVVGSLAQVVDKATTTTKLESSANPSVDGAKVSFTVIVASSATGVTGSAELFDGTTSLGEAKVTDGKATFATSTLEVGDHALSAKYKGDTSFTPSTSTMLTQTVNAIGHTIGSRGPEPAPVSGGSGGDDGCGCRVTAPRPTRGAALFAVGVALALAVRRRRRTGS